MSGKRDDLEIVIGADLSGLAADFARGVQMNKTFARDIERSSPKSVDLAPRIDPSNFNRASAAIKGAGLSVKSMAADLVGFGAKAAIAGGALLGIEAGLNGVGSALEQVKSSVVMAAEFEQNQIAFEAMLGSAEKATVVMGDLRKFAAETPFSSKEVTDGARQLLAYGIAADDLIPTLKTLGTISAGTAKPLADNILRYGTTRVQGRAMQQDINQFTGSGADILPGLAKSLKIDVSQVKRATEDGRVGVEELNFALEDLAKNRFAGLLEKQSNSLKGSWEQLTDAFDKAKLKLGQVIAQEVGLRGAAKDLEGFAGRIERAFDSERFRSGVRFVGDLVKGGAQLASEFGKAGLEIARINLDGLARTNPELAQLAKNAQAFVASLKDFKFDERAIAGFGVSLFKAIAYPMADLVDWVQVEGKGYADAFRENFVDPIEEALGYWREFKDGVKGVGNFIADQSPSGLGGLSKDVKTQIEERRSNRTYFRDIGIAVPSEKAFDERMLAEAVEVAKAAQDRTLTNPPRWEEPPDQVRARFAQIEKMIDKGSFLAETSGWKQFQPFLDELRNQRGGFLQPYSVDPGGHLNELRKQFEAGKVPDRRADYFDPALKPVPRNNRETLDQRVRGVEEFVFGEIDARKVRSGFARMAESIRANEATARTLGTSTSLAALGPFGGLAPEVSSLTKSDLYLPKDNRTPAHLVDLAGKLNEQFNPAMGLNAKLADLKSIFDKGLINGDVFGKARDSMVRDVADKMGLNQPSRLPDTVLAGSQDDARLLAQAMGSPQQKSTEDLLRQIVNVLERSRDLLMHIEHQGSKTINLGFGWAGL